jgi:anti-anti-sigma regulatory factor
MKFYLIVATGKKQGMPIPIDIDLFLIGAAKECQLRAKVPGVGEQQCALVTRERKCFVRDLNSGHPTLLNDELVPPGDEWPLHPGDRLKVSRLEFMVQFTEKPLSQRDLEEWALRCLDVSSQPELDDEDEFGSNPATADTPAQAAASILDRLQARRGLVCGRLRIGREEGVLIVRFNDVSLVEEAEIALVRKELRDNLTRPNLRVLLDCKNVKRMSTTAVQMLDELFGWLRPWGSSLALCRVRPELEGILHVLHLNHSIPHFKDKQTALTTRW